MFGFFKKKENKTKNITDHKKELTNEEIEDIKSKISTLKDSAVEKDEIYYEELGLLYSKIEETDLSIDYLEKSMRIKPSVGKGYKALMALYNTKRAESAKNGEDNGIEYYMDKMDELRQIARKYTIGN